MSTALAKLQADRERRGPLLWPGARRVLGLPDKREENIPDLTNTYAITDEYKLRPIQSQMLHEISRCKGLVAAVGVGHGKTLPSFLAATALGAKRPILLVPPALVKQTNNELARFRKHFRIVPNLEVVSYGKLSVANGTTLLEEMQPDLIIADECHMLRHSSSARTKRVLRYFRKHPDTYFVALSGTLTSKSLKDYAHLVELALRDKAPIPLDYPELVSWAECIDVYGDPAMDDFGVIRPIIQAWGEGMEATKSSARKAFQNRFHSAPGVVATTDQAVKCSLYIQLLDDLKMPPSIKHAVKELERDWCTPGGEELEDAVALARHRRHLISGFYYSWDWGEGGPDYEWLEARKNWHINVRRVLSNSREGRDSPLLVARWVMSGECRDLEILRAWEAWDGVRDRPLPPVDTNWIDTYLVDYLFHRALNNRKPLIVWTQYRAVLEALEEKGLPCFGAGTEPPEDPITCAMSIKAHGTGRNLQGWAHNLLASFPPNGVAIEQLIGRTHRPGQDADEVMVDFLLPHHSVKDDVEQALMDSEYIEETQGNKTKLLSATWI